MQVRDFRVRIRDTTAIIQSLYACLVFLGMNSTNKAALLTANTLKTLHWHVYFPIYLDAHARLDLRTIVGAIRPQ